MIFASNYSFSLLLIDLVMWYLRPLIILLFMHNEGNMWAQNWESLFPLLVPAATTPHNGTNNSRNILSNFDSFEDLAKVAETFFLSLGFQRLPLSFWKRSQFVKPVDGRKTVCHASSVNFYLNQDVR